MDDDYSLNDDADMIDEPDLMNTPRFQSDVDSNSVDSNSLTLENPYDKHWKDRDKVKHKSRDALRKWKRKVKVWSILLLLTSAGLMYSNIWYANVIGVAAASLGLYGAVKQNSEFLFVFLVLLFLELLKNVGVFYYFVSGEGSDDGPGWSSILSCALCLVEELVVVPANIYFAFKLYRTLKISAQGDGLDETLSNF